MRRHHRTLQATVVIAMLLLTTWSARAQTPVVTVRWTLPLVVHITQVASVQPSTDAGASAAQPVVDDAFIDERVARANEIYERYGIRFIVRQRVHVPIAIRAQLDTREERDALAAFATPAAGAIHCFFVAALRDVDQPSDMRRGVHWHASTSRTHYVIVSAIAGLNVLAHELGHFLGHPEHSLVRDNLMSYDQSGALPFLDDEQQRRMWRRITRYVHEHELVPVPAKP